MLVFNAHLHLNGSISLAYLKEAAIRNNCLEFYQKFVDESDVWKKFSLIHQVIQTIKDIRLAVIDVVSNSNADILEIRTTAKKMNNQAVEEYIQAFIEGLLEAKELYLNKKARGLLSIDRTRHSLEEAKTIVDIALKEKQATGMIVGIDLSGNFLGKRILTCEDLYRTIKYALDKDIGLALHVGEVDSEVERQDFDLILKAIQEYQGEIQGKVRLGHAIYRTSFQDEIIKKYQIPVEICPSCHQQAGWWKQGEAHPILTLYRLRSQVISGTDDNLIFGSNDASEQRKLDEIMDMSDEYLNLTREEQDEKLTEQRKHFMF